MLMVMKNINKTQMVICIQQQMPEPSLFANMKYGSRRRANEFTEDEKKKKIWEFRKYELMPYTGFQMRNKHRHKRKLTVPISDFRG